MAMVVVALYIRRSDRYLHDPDQPRMLSIVVNRKNVFQGVRVP